MVNAVSRTFPLDLMMKSVHFQVKKRLIFEFQNVAVGLSAYPPLSAASTLLAQRRIRLSSRLALSPISLARAKRSVAISEPI